MKAYGQRRYVGPHRVDDYPDMADLMLLGKRNKSTRRLQKKGERAAQKRELRQELREVAA